MTMSTRSGTTVTDLHRTTLRPKRALPLGRGTESPWSVWALQGDFSPAKLGLLDVGNAVFRYLLLMAAAILSRKAPEGS
jgi:hypothetical protein